MYLITTKAIHDKLITTIILNREKNENISPEVRKRKACQLSPLLLNIALEFLARAIRQEEEIKVEQSVKK
jgi:hypothetical protein